MLTMLNRSVAPSLRNQIRGVRRRIQTVSSCKLDECLLKHIFSWCREFVKIFQCRELPWYCLCVRILACPFRTVPQGQDLARGQLRHGVIYLLTLPKQQVHKKAPSTPIHTGIERAVAAMNEKVATAQIRIECESHRKVGVCQCSQSVVIQIQAPIVSVISNWTVLLVERQSVTLIKRCSARAVFVRAGSTLFEWFSMKERRMKRAMGNYCLIDSCQ